MDANLRDLDLKKLIRFDAAFWDDLAIRIQQWIEADMDEGILQQGVGVYSRDYAKYKANYMNRFTTGGTLQSTYIGKRRGLNVDITEGNRLFGKRKRGAGKKIKAYEGRSVISNWTKSVNMKLTGALIMGLKKLRSDEHSLTMTYDKKDIDKIKGNAALGRIVTTLNDENRTKAKSKLLEQTKENLKDIFRGTIVIEVGK